MDTVVAYTRFADDDWRPVYETPDQRQYVIDEKGQIVADTFENEFRRTMDNIKKVLAGAKLTLADVVQVRSYVAKQEDLAEYNRIYREYFSEPFPTRTTITNCLPPALKFEIEAVAVKKSA